MKTKNTTKPEGHPVLGNAFSQMIRTNRRGAIDIDASAKLQECIDSAMLHGRKAELTLKISFQPQGDDQVIISADCKTKVPENEIPKGVAYVDDNGQLQQTDPKQPELDLTEVVVDEEVTEVETSEEVEEVKEA